MKLEFLAEVISNRAWREYTGTDYSFRQDPSNASKMNKLSNLRKGFAELFGKVFGKLNIKNVRVAAAVGGNARQGIRLYVKLKEGVEISEVEQIVKGISQQDVARVINDYIRKGGVNVPHEMIDVKYHVYILNGNAFVTVMVDVTWPSMVAKIDDSSYIKKVVEYVNKLLAANEVVHNAVVTIDYWNAPTIQQNDDGSKASVIELNFDINIKDALADELKAKIAEIPYNADKPGVSISPEAKFLIEKDKMVMEQVVVPINQKLQNIVRKNEHLQDVYIIRKKHPWMTDRHSYFLVIKEVV